MEVIKLKTPKGKEIEIPLSEKETDIEKPRLTIIKNGKKLYAPLVKEKPKNNEEEFIIVRTNDGINYYVGESKKKDTIPSGMFEVTRNFVKYKEIDGEKLIYTFQVPEKINMLYIENILDIKNLGPEGGYYKVKPFQKFAIEIYCSLLSDEDRKELEMQATYGYTYSINDISLGYSFDKCVKFKIRYSKEINNYKGSYLDISDVEDYKEGAKWTLQSQIKTEIKEL